MSKGTPKRGMLDLHGHRELHVRMHNIFHKYHSNIHVRKRRRSMLYMNVSCFFFFYRAHE